MQNGRILKEIRTQNHESQSEIAELLNTTQQQYWKYEKEQQEMPIRHLITLAKHYHITTDEILGLKQIDNNRIETIELINKFSRLSEIDKGRILGRIDEILESKSSRIIKQ